MLMKQNGHSNTTQYSLRQIIHIVTRFMLYINENSTKVSGTLPVHVQMNTFN